MSIGVPIKVLHEAEGHIVTCETITGEVYRGKLIEAEDNMNCQMTQITVTYRDGRTSNLENVYIRGSKIRFLILPDMLKNAPMFKKQGTKAAGRGKSAILRAQGKPRVNVSRVLFVNPSLIFQRLEAEEEEVLQDAVEAAEEVAHGREDLLAGGAEVANRIMSDDLKINSLSKYSLVRMTIYGRLLGTLRDCWDSETCLIHYKLNYLQ